MYKLENLDWLPKPHSLKFIKRKLSDYKYTSAIVFVISNNRTLLVNVKSRGWDFVGGRIEEGETIKECAKREFLEETGFSIKKMKFVGSHKIDCFSNPKGSKTAQAIYIGVIDEKVSELLEDDILECDWFSIHEMKQFNFPEWKYMLINYIFNIK